MENNVTDKNSINPDLSPSVDAATAPTVTLALDVNELNVIIGGLQELPHRVVDALLKKIVQQAQEQLGQSA